MNVVWSRRAIRHLTAIRMYIETDSDNNAAIVAERVLDADLLNRHPQIGRPGRLPGNRELD